MVNTASALRVWHKTQHVVEGRGQERDQMDAAVMPDLHRQLLRLAYNLGNIMRALAMPKTAQPWSLTSLHDKLIKIGAKVVSHGRYVMFRMTHVAISRQTFAEILSLITRSHAPPAPARYGPGANVAGDEGHRVPS